MRSDGLIDGMNAVIPKRGRRAKHYISSDGTQIKGLAKDEKSGRWRIIANNRFFREPDETKAIERYRRMTSGVPTLPEQIAAGVYMPDHIGTLLGRILSAVALRELELGGILPNTANNSEPEDELWRIIGEEIRTRPQFVAQKTGVEQIGYLAHLKPPVPLPTFALLKAIWKEHSRSGAEQVRKVIHAWNDFVATAKIGELSDISAEVVIGYRDAVWGRQGSPKSQSNQFSRIRRLVTFARDRGVAITALNEINQCLKLLKPSDSTVSIDPQPIELDDWKKLLGVAKGDDRAMLLLMMNGAFYLQEVIRLRWDETRKGCIITNRKKTGRCIRVCTLWPETIAALDQVKRQGEQIFYAYHGSPIGIKGAELRFRRLRDAAALKVTSSHLRDGAATAAAEHNVNNDLCAIMMGHRSGIKDHYVLRNPKMVKPATDAVYSHYFQ